MVHRFIFWLIEEFVWKQRELPRRFPVPPRRGQNMMDIVSTIVHPQLYNEFVEEELARVRKEQDAEFKVAIAPHSKIFSETELNGRALIEDEEDEAWSKLILQKPVFSELELKKASIENRKRELEEKMKKKEPKILGTVKKMHSETVAAAAASSSPSPSPAMGKAAVPLAAAATSASPNAKNRTSNKAPAPATLAAPPPLPSKTTKRR